MENVFREIHCGVNFGFYAKNGYYSSDAAKKQVDDMVQTGVNWVVLIVTVMQESFASTRQFRDFTNTPNDLELKEIIDYMHSKGLHVQLRPMLECYDGKGRLGVYFPKDCERIPGLVCDYASKWFASMDARACYYAHIAQLTGCEMYCLDSELDLIIQFNDEWKQVLRNVRNIYHGAVTSCHTYHTKRIDFEAVLQDKNHWFYDLDALSISGYFSCSDGQPGHSKEEMVEKIIPQCQQLRRIAEMYGKPIFFGETGCTAVAGATRSPSAWNSEPPEDQQEQANYLDALIEVFSKESWWKGLYWWKWDEHVPRPWLNDPKMRNKDFRVQGKIAQNIMRNWFFKLQGK